MADTFYVEGYKTIYKSIVKARAAAYRMFQKEKNTVKFGKRGVQVKIFEKIAPNVFSEIGYLADSKWVIGAVGMYTPEDVEMILVDSKGKTFVPKR